MDRTALVVLALLGTGAAAANAADAPITLSAPKVERLSSSGHPISADVAMPRCPIGVRVEIVVNTTGPATVQYHWETEFADDDYHPTPPVTLTLDKAGTETVRTGATVSAGRVTARVGSGVRTKQYSTQLIVTSGGTTVKSEKVSIELKCRVI